MELNEQHHSKAADNISKAELKTYNDAIQNLILIGQITAEECNWPSEEKYQRKIIAAVHLGNPMCHQCQKANYKDKNVTLTPCEKCCLVFYCSDKCRQDHADEHAKMCCNPDATFDAENDPYRPAFVKLN